MKVYATAKIDNEVQLLEWDSVKEFEKNESWVNPKFINVATTKDLENYADFGEYKSMVVLTKDQTASCQLLKETYCSRKNKWKSSNRR